MYPLTTLHEIVGAHIDLAAVTAQTITMDGAANGLILQADVQIISYKLSGVPTATSGFRIAAAAAPVILPIARGQSIQVIEAASGGLAVHQKIYTPVLEPWLPVGTHVTTAVLSSEVTLTKPEWANAILMQAFTQNLRIKLRAAGGADASGTLGFVQTAAQGVVLRYLGDYVDEVSVFEDAASATMEHQFLHIGG